MEFNTHLWNESQVPWCKLIQLYLRVMFNLLVCHPTILLLPVKGVAHDCDGIFIYLFIGGAGERLLSRFHARCRAPSRTRSHNCEILIWAEIWSWWLNQLSHLGTPVMEFLVQTTSSTWRNHLWWRNFKHSFVKEGKNPNSKGYMCPYVYSSIIYHS